MAEEPRRLVLNLKDAAGLVSRNAPLGRTHEVRGLEALVERDANVLEHRADRHPELRFAVAALVKTDADALLRVRLDLADPAGATALRTNRTVRPNDAFEESEGGFFIVKVRAGKNGHGTNLQCRQPTPGWPGLQDT